MVTVTCVVEFREFVKVPLAVRVADTWENFSS